MDLTQSNKWFNRIKSGRMFDEDEERSKRTTINITVVNVPMLVKN